MLKDERDDLKFFFEYWLSLAIARHTLFQLALGRFTFAGTYVLYFSGTCVLTIIPGTQAPVEMAKIIMHYALAYFSPPWRHN